MNNSDKLNKITELLNLLEKDYNIESWENMEGRDIICEKFIFGVPYDDEKIISLEVKDDEIEDVSKDKMSVQWKDENGNVPRGL